MAQIKVNEKSNEITAIPESLGPAAHLASKHCPADDDFTDTDAGYGRVETRRTGIYRDTSYISQFRAGARAIIRVDSTRYDKTENRYTLQQTRFYITSLPSVRAKDFSRLIRSRRGIENQLHWVLDMAFNEDGSQKRAENSAENFSGILRLARNILNRYKDLHPSRISYRSMMLRAALNPTFASEVIQAVFA